MSLCFILPAKIGVAVEHPVKVESDTSRGVYEVVTGDQAIATIGSNGVMDALAPGRTIKHTRLVAG